MAKKSRESGAKVCVCNKCGAEASSIPGRLHRRCSGTEGKIRPKHDALSSDQKGTWN